MHLNILLLASGFIAWAGAQVYLTPPSCSDDCFEIYLSMSGCSSTDIKCLCLNTAYRENVARCAIGACSTSDYTLLLQDSAYNCQLVGVTSIATATAAATAAATAPNYAYPTSKDPSGNTYKVPSSSRKSSRLSSGGKYGLGFGIPAAVLAAIGAIFKVYRSKQKKEKAAGESKPVVQVQEQPKMDQQPFMNQQPAMNQQPFMNQQPVMNQQPAMNQQPIMNQQPVVNQAQWDTQNAPRYEVQGQQAGHGFQTTQPTVELPVHIA